MKSPAISVIIPVYNQEKYVGKCIRSVLGQSFQDFEVIIVNDGSMDKSQEICRKYAKKDSRISIIDKQNEGLPRARYSGLMKASGEFVLFLDSDDYLTSTALEKLHLLAKTHQADLIIGNHDRVLDSLGLIKWGYTPFVNSDRLISGPDVMDLMWGNNGDIHNLGYMWGRLYRRSCILEAIEDNVENIFKRDLKIIEDIYANISLAPHIKSVWITNDIICHYRYGGGISGLVPLIRNAGSVFDKQVELCRQYNRYYILPKIFDRYIGFLNTNILSELHFHAYSEDNIRAFLRNELESRKLVQWARENMKDKDKQKYRQYLELQVDDIIDSIKCQERSLWKHYLLKKIVLKYQRITSFLYL